MTARSIVSSIVRKSISFMFNDRKTGRALARYVTDETTKTKRLIGILTKRVCSLQYDTCEN